MSSTDGPRSTGNIAFLLSGSMVVGPDWRYMVCSYVLLVVGTILFVAYTCTFVAASVVASILCVLSMGLLALCGFTNPGFVPRGPLPPPGSPPHEVLWEEANYVRADGTPGRARFERKWCYACNVHRPIRCVHCRFCDMCVMRRDHHCQWMGICIGERNYVYYYSFVWSVAMLTVTVFVGCVVSFVGRITKHNHAHPPTGEHSPNIFLASMRETYGIELLLLFLSLAWFILTFFLAVHHTYLISQNMTSGDYTRQARNENVFDQGSLLANVRASLFLNNEGSRSEVFLVTQVEETVVDVDPDGVEGGSRLTL